LSSNGKADPPGTRVDLGRFGRGAASTHAVVFLLPGYCWGVSAGVFMACGILAAPSRAPWGDIRLLRGLGPG
jgi:enoyl-CoA hydratase/carnithine racemase